MTWILLALVLAVVIRFFWKNYIHRANVMIRQGANMNWAASGRIKCETGGYDTLLTRSGYTVRISWRDGTLTMTNPPSASHFADFIAIERWVHEQEKDQTSKENAVFEYFEKVMDVIMQVEKAETKDLYSTISAMKASSIGYLQASMSLVRTGFNLDVDPFLIGMMHVTALANAAEEGKDLYDYSILYLRSVEKNLLEHKIDDLN